MSAAEEQVVFPAVPAGLRSGLRPRVLRVPDRPVFPAVPAGLRSGAFIVNAWLTVAGAVFPAVPAGLRSGRLKP